MNAAVSYWSSVTQLKLVYILSTEDRKKSNLCNAARLCNLIHFNKVKSEEQYKRSGI